MSAPGSLLPPDVVEALGRGQTVEAIKRLRKATGLGLAEAKATIDAHLRTASGAARSVDPRAAAATAIDQAGLVLPEVVLEALRRGDKLGAVRLLRERTGLGLKAARKRIEAASGSSLDSGAPPHEFAPAPAVEMPRNAAVPQPPLTLDRRGLGRGEVPRSNAAAWWIALLAAAAFAIYYFSSGI
jgi:ribosomal protein L7/L12